jgi:pimeloyl-ACP methyl ester carboxylesterase
MLRRALVSCLTIAVVLIAGFASPPARGEAMGTALEGFPYPYPVHFMPLALEGEDLRLAYMDVASVGPSNGRTVVLLHGRNFRSSYWEPTIKALTEAGYRVVAPDQIGFGKSSKPTFAYSLDSMARVTIALIDSLHVDRFDLVGHSMGGMLAVRLARASGSRIDHLVLYSPIGLTARVRGSGSASSPCRCSRRSSPSS